MSLQWEKIMWIEEYLNWIPTKSVPVQLDALTGAHSFIRHLEILQGALEKGKEILTSCWFISLPVPISSWKICGKSSESSFCMNMCLFRLIMMRAAEKPAEIGKNNTEDLLANESMKGQISGCIESFS